MSSFLSRVLFLWQAHPVVTPAVIPMLKPVVIIHNVSYSIPLTLETIWLEFKEAIWW
jgi:hypothetical protein